MPMPVALDRYYTREEVLSLPDDGNRYELVHGELLVSPSPRAAHQTVLLKVALVLSEYVREQAVGHVFIAPADISFGKRDDVLVQPDVFVIGPEYGSEPEWDDIRSLALVVEVASPSTARYDRFTKRRLYQAMQVPVYWIIDSAARRAEEWTPEATAPRFQTERFTWRPEGAAVPLVVELAELLGA